LVERKKSLQVTKKNNERLLKNAKELRDDMAMCENKCQGSSNLVDVDQGRALVIKLVASLIEVEGDL
jgi:hypothetical protein